MGDDMRVEVIVVRYWYQDKRYMGHQPAPLDEQLSKKLETFLNRGVKIHSMQQSLARSQGVETCIVTILYEKR